MERDQQMNQVATSYNEGKIRIRKGKIRTQAAITMPQLRRKSNLFKEIHKL